MGSNLNLKPPSVKANWAKAMVRVYFENLGADGNPNYAELVAILDNEETYERLLPVFEKMAEDAGMIITESIEDTDINEL